MQGVRRWRSGEVLPSHQCGLRSIPRLGVIYRFVEFVGSLLSLERFFSRYSRFPLSLKTNIGFDFRQSGYSVPN